MPKDNNRYTLTRWQKIWSSTLYGLCRCVAILPRFVRYYILQEFIYFILHYVIRYRRRVVMDNLRNAFPEKDEKEIRGIAKRFDNYLAEQMINTISLAGITSKQRMRLLHFPDVEYYVKTTEHSDTVLLAAHHGCWEYLSTVACYDKKHRLMSVYHPLSNSALDDMFKRLRRCENTELVPRDDSLLHFMRHRGKEQKISLGLIADQNPFRYHGAHWITFFNQDTIFAQGGEQIAMKFKLPVWFGYMRRVRRGEYQLCVELLYDGKEEVAPNVITERYVHRLEAVIRECPELWLWSHRRWKCKRTI